MAGDTQVHDSLATSHNLNPPSTPPDTTTTSTPPAAAVLTSVTPVTVAGGEGGGVGIKAEPLQRAALIAEQKRLARERGCLSVSLCVCRDFRADVTGEVARLPVCVSVCPCVCVCVCLVDCRPEATGEGARLSVYVFVCLSLIVEQKQLARD